MDSILALLGFIEKFPVTGAALLSLAVAGIIGIAGLIVTNLTERKKFPYVKPYYWGLSKNFNITTVLQHFPDNDASGYRQEQYSRPDLWRSKVLKVSFFGFFHKIVPLNESDILIVLVRRKRKEKSIVFNKSI